MAFALLVLFSLLGSLGSLALAAIFMLLPKERRQKLIPSLVAFATGTLLAVAFTGLIPEALDQLPAQNVFLTVLTGILLFFCLEKIFIWRHCHDGECSVHDASAKIMLLGDAAHNFTDGVMMAAAFLVSIPFGVIIGLSTFIHEIPQEMGDFSILLHNGWSRKKALFWNAMAGLTIPAATVSYFALEHIQAWIPYVMALSAASFIYIALVDLSPELHKHTSWQQGVRQVVLILGGVATMLLLATWLK